MVFHLQGNIDDDKSWENQLTPSEIVAELDRYIVGQLKAKRAVAIALRNRIRRQKLSPEMAEEVAPKNIIMIGPTGVGKTEIARRLARLANSPFIKVEASKFTEVGYVGRDVESMIRDLTEISVEMVKQDESRRVRTRAERNMEERLLDLLLPPMPQPPGMSRPGGPPQPPGSAGMSGGDRAPEPAGYTATSTGAGTSPGTGTASTGTGAAPAAGPGAGAPSGTGGGSYSRTREKLRSQLSAGALEDRTIEVEVQDQSMSSMQIFSNQGVENMGINVKEMFPGLFGGKKKRRRMTIAEAREHLMQEEETKLVDMDQVTRKAMKKVEWSGIIFLDEIDKVAARQSGHGPDVSREGVQRDILPIVEGTTVQTKYGLVRTDHILFIAAGAFHMSKPSDLMPELQGRFPIRVELNSLGVEDFKRILVEPRNALIKQYTALMKTEGIELTFTPEAIHEIASFASQVNERTENIGARRLHTILEKLLDEISFEGANLRQKDVTIDEIYVRRMLADIIEDQDLSRYIL